MNYSVIAIGFPADSVKPGVEGTVYEGGQNDTYPRELTHDLFRVLCLEFVAYQKECQAQLDLLLDFLKRRRGGDSSLESSDFVVNFFDSPEPVDSNDLDDYLKTLVKPLKRKTGRNAEQDASNQSEGYDDFELAQKKAELKEAALACQCCLQAYTEILEVDTVDGSKQAYRQREVAAIRRPSTVLCKDWNDMLHRLVQANCAKELDQENEIRANKRQKKAEPPNVLELLGVIDRRELRTGTLKNGHEDWFHVVRTVIGHNCKPLRLLDSGSDDAERVLKHPNGLYRQGIGPWSVAWKECPVLSQLCVEKVFALEMEVCRLNNKETIAPTGLKHKGQQNPVSYSGSGDVTNMFSKIDLSFPFDNDKDAMERCVFALDFYSPTTTTRSHIDDISFLCFWLHLEEIENMQLTKTDNFANSASRFKDYNECLPSSRAGGIQMAKDRTRSGKVHKQVAKGTITVDRTSTEKDKLRERFANCISGEQNRIDRLRKCEGDPDKWFSNTCGEGAIDAINHYTGIAGVTRQAIEHVFKNVIMDANVCESARAVLGYGVNANNGLANCSSAQSKRWVTNRFSADMSESCNALQKYMWAYEEMGMAHLHRPFMFMHQAAMDSMIPHDGMFVNCLVYGAADCGKSYALDLMERIMIEGSFITEQQMTAAAHKNYEGPQEMQVRGIHEVAEHLEKQQGSNKGKDDPSSARQDALKTELTENVSITVTPMPGIMESGMRQNLKYKKKVLRCNLAGGNIADPWSQMPKAILSRFFPIPATSVNAEGRNAHDKKIQKSMCNDALEIYRTNQIIGHFRQTQWFFASIGLLTESGMFLPPNELAFQVALHQLGKTFNELNFAPASRMIEQARIMSRVNMYMGIFERNFAHPYSKFTKGVEFEPVELMQLQDQMVMSLSNAWAGIQQVLVARLYVSELASIMRAVMQLVVEKKYGDYSSLFCFEPPNVRKFTGKGVPSDEPLQVDLHYVTLFIGTNHKAYDSFCAELSQKLKGNKMSKDQVKGFINHLFHNSESAWRTVNYEDELDMIIDANEDTFDNTDMESVVLPGCPISLNAYRAISKDKGWPDKVNKGMLSEAHRKWEQCGNTIDHNNPMSRFFPFQTGVPSKQASLKQTWVNDLGQGIIKVSTYALRLFGQQNYETEFADKLSAKSMQLACITNGFMANVPSDLSSINKHVPYLVDVEQLNSGKEAARIVNQRYVNKRVHQVLNIDTERAAAQTMPRFNIPREIPLSTHCATLHIQAHVARSPENPPSAHRIIAADPDGLCLRLCPYLCITLVEATPANMVGWQAWTSEKQHDAMVAYLNTNYEDLIWPMDERNVPWSSSEKAIAEKQRFANEIAEIVFAMINSDGVGKMAQVAANNIDNDVDPNLDEIELESSKQYCTNHNNKVLQAIKQRSAQTKQLANASDAYPFVQQWKALGNKGAHNGKGYVELIRKTAKRMINEWRKCDGWWVLQLKQNQHIGSGHSQ